MHGVLACVGDRIFGMTPNVVAGTIAEHQARGPLRLCLRALSRPVALDEMPKEIGG
jgi:hypothetical protein